MTPGNGGKADQWQRQAAYGSKQIAIGGGKKAAKKPAGKKKPAAKKAPKKK